MKSTLETFIKLGKATNCNLCNHHVALWWEWFHKTWCPCMFAKSRKMPQIPFTIPASAKPGEYWEADFIFLGPLIFLVTIEIISKLTLALRLTSRAESSTSEVSKVWFANLSKYFQGPLKITITSDQEKNIKNSFEKLPNVSVVPMPTDMHASLVEVTNRTLRERVGSIYYATFNDHGYT